MSDVEIHADADQAQAELEACLRAAAKAHGARIDVVWIDTGGRVARLSFRLDAAWRIRIWRQARLAFGSVSAGALLGCALATLDGSGSPALSALSASAAAVAASAHLAASWRLSKLTEATAPEVVATAVSLADKFEIEATFGPDHWHIAWERRPQRYTS